MNTFGGGGAMDPPPVARGLDRLCSLTFTITLYSRCLQIPASASDRPTLLGPIALKLYHLSNLLLFHPCQDNLLWVSAERLGGALPALPIPPRSPPEGAAIQSVA